MKATGLILGLTVVVAAPFIALLYREVAETVQMGNEASDAAKTAVEQVTLLNRRLEMETLLKYKDDPSALESTKAANAKAQKETDDLAKKIATQRAALAQKSSRLAAALGVGLALFLGLVAIAGVYFTHKVVGPIYRMRALFREVGEGKFSPYRPLRKGDELQEFFVEFSDMVEKLRERQREEIVHLNTAIEKAAEAGVSDGSLRELRVVRDKMEKAVAGKA